MTYTDAVTELKKASVKFEFPVEWGIDLQSEHERYLTDVVFKAPVIVTDYPKGIKAFYMKQNPDGKTVAAMDVLAPRIGEIIGGSQREDRLDLLQGRMREMSLPLDDMQWYLDLRRYGSCPHAGFGLGFERLVQYVSGMGNIRDVIPCPRAPGLINY
jgi:asparaginyl-tRNA synthetase